MAIPRWRFRALDGGTQVDLTLEYELPGGRLGHALARLLGENPREKVEEDLHRFKQVIEWHRARER